MPKDGVGVGSPTLVVSGCGMFIGGCKARGGSVSKGIPSVRWEQSELSYIARTV